MDPVSHSAFNRKGIMSIPLQETAKKRRWPRVLVIIGAIVALILGSLFLYGKVTTSPTTDQPVLASNPQAHTWYFDKNNQVTRATNRDGEVPYNSGSWSEEDYAVKEHGIYSSKFVTIDLYMVDATLAAPDKAVGGVTSLEVTITTDQFGALAEAYNTHNDTRDWVMGNGQPPTEGERSAAEFMLREVLASESFRKKVKIPFVTIDPKTETNKIVADAYAKGYEPWELAKGTPGFHYDNEYVWDFTCTRYDVIGQADAQLAELQEAAPPLELTLAVGDGFSSQGMDFWQGGEYWVEATVPCGIDVVSSGSPDLPPEAGTNPGKNP